MLAGELSFQTVPQRWPQVLAQSEQQVSCFDLSQLGRCDSAGLAMLVELKAQARSRGSYLSFCNLPPALRQLAKVSGVEILLTAEES